MTTSAEHEPKAVSEDAIEAWHEAVDLARQERRQRGERYTGRHRPAPSDSADGQTQSELSAWIASWGIDGRLPSASTGNSSEGNVWRFRVARPNTPPWDIGGGVLLPLLARSGQRHRSRDGFTASDAN